MASGEGFARVEVRSTAFFQGLAALATAFQRSEDP
jgi:hypothetical protein